MAVTVTNKIPQQALSVGNIRGRVVTVTLALNDYLTGGVAVTPASVNLAEIYGAVVIGQDSVGAGYLPVWRTDTNKLQLFQSTTGAPNILVELPNATSVASTFRLLVLGV